MDVELTRRALLLGAAGLAASASLFGRRPDASQPAEQVVQLGDLSLHVASNPFRLALYGPDGQVVWQDPSDGGLEVFTADGSRYVATHLLSWTPLGPDAVQVVSATTDPERSLALEIRSLAPRAFRLTITPSQADDVVALGGSFGTDGDEHLVGLGERFNRVDQMGLTADVWTQDRRLADYGDSTYAPVPLVWSSKGYGMVLERFERAHFDLAASAPDRWHWQQSAASVSLVLSYGPSLKELLQQHASLFGLPPLPPMWTFGVWKVSIGGTDQVMTEMRKLRDMHVPISAAFVFDALDDAANIGWPTVNFAGRQTGKYPDLPTLTRGLHGLGLKALNYLTADFHLERASYAEPASHGFFVKQADERPYLQQQFKISWLDFTNQDARDWWRRLWRRALVDDGFDGGMLDLGELIPEDAVFDDGTSGSQSHNRYPGLYAEAAWQEATAVRPNGDVVLLMRSATLGAQRTQSLVWPGDPRMRWEGPDGFQSMVPAALSFGLSGFPYWCAEVAGYVQVDLSPEQERELWFRWLQFGTWTATLRDHYGDHPNAPVDAWHDDQTMAAFRDAARTHNSLVPYLYSCAAEASRTGLPIMRHLALELPDDPRSWTEEQTYLLGPLLLVAPVVQSGAESRRVYLPLGSDWVDYWTGQVHPGGQEVTVPAPLDGGHAPAFVRGGSVLPLAADFDSLVLATEPNISTYAGDLVVRVWPGSGGPTSFLLYDGTSLAWDGQTLHVTSNPRSRTIELRTPDGRSISQRVDGATADLAPGSG